VVSVIHRSSFLHWYDSFFPDRVLFVLQEEVREMVNQLLKKKNVFAPKPKLNVRACGMAEFVQTRVFFKIDAMSSMTCLPI
jgi:hypothetical protein